MSKRARRSEVTGVIAAAGSASRMWPASKVYPKELFPLGRLPVLAHVIWEMLDAGITNIVIIVRKSGFNAIEAFLDPASPPPASVRKDPLVQRFERLIRRGKFTFVEQEGPYGNGTPLLCGVRATGGGPYVYAFADDVVLGENASAGLIATHAKTGSVVLAAQRVPAADASKFGIVESRRRDGTLYASRFIEKPRAGETRSRLASLGRYLITDELVDVLEQTPTGRDGELWLADGFRSLLDAGRPLAVFPLTKGRWHTVGNPAGYRGALLAGMQAEESGDLYAPKGR
jgi:UTP--glucose-1-phosphate uridylyltransferase